MIALAGCGDDPLVIFHVTSTIDGVTGTIQACEAGSACTGELAQVLKQTERSADGALFHVPAGIEMVPIQVTEGGAVTAMCTRRVVPLENTPVELKIAVGSAAPTIDCPSDVPCGALEPCCNNLGQCPPP